MASVKIKVCGITSLLDAEKAIEFGADMLGFNFYPPSPRCITPEQARDMLGQLPRDCFNIALFVNEPREKVAQTIAQGVLADGRQAYAGLQFHGEESADYCRGWDLKVIKAIRVKERASLDVMQSYGADFYLLDSFSAGYGGSGAQFPWEWLDGIDASKLILSGGLRVDNVAEAIRRIHPYGVDVCSGVEARPGIKDHGKLKEFITAAKAA
ncbi:MAG: phosphoribosylanthranilate isomerase [Deltaproteobacteria bacterium]|nr:phosphoribosylanthranilate isomerase [Deltaproteobacteria bacterium]